MILTLELPKFLLLGKDMMLHTILGNPWTPFAKLPLRHSLNMPSRMTCNNILPGPGRLPTIHMRCLATYLMLLINLHQLRGGPHAQQAQLARMGKNTGKNAIRTGNRHAIRRGKRNLHARNVENVPKAHEVPDTKEAGSDIAYHIDPGIIQVQEPTDDSLRTQLHLEHS